VIWLLLNPFIGFLPGRREKCLCLVFVAVTLLVTRVEAREIDVTIGVLAKRGAEYALKRWGPTADYLSENILGYRFSIIPLTFEAIHSAVERGTVDFVLANPSIYVDMEIRYGVSRIATLKNRYGRHAYTRFGGVIFTRADHPGIRRLSDLRGREFMAVDEWSLGGYQAARLELQQREGMVPERDFASLRFGGTHDAVVLAVREGRVDAGTVRSDTLERMASEGTIRLEEFRVLGAHSREDFPFLVSTSLYPEWPFAKVRHTPDDLADRVAAALLSLSPDSRAAVSGDYSGWTVPHNYRSVHQLMQTLRVGPYAHHGEFGLADMVRQYGHWLGALALALVMLGIGMVHVSRLNHRLHQSRTQLQRAHDQLEARVAQRTRELNEALDELESQHRYQEVILNTAEEGIYGIDTEGRTTFVNRAAARMLGYSPEELIGRVNHELIHHSRSDGSPYPASECMMYKAIRSGRPQLVEGEVLWRKDGSCFPVEYCSAPIMKDGKVSGAVITFRDVSERKRMEERIRYQAYYDALTELPNRRLLMDRLQQAIARARRHGYVGAILFLDLDHFKAINDSLGHGVGDALLQRVASRLSRSLRQEDTASRLGGDEFVVLLPELSGEIGRAAANARRVAEKIIDVLAQPMVIEERQLHVTTSIGIALFPTLSYEADDILKHADMAMYRAKEGGRNSYHFFHSAMQEAADHRLAMEKELHAALEEDRLELHFQPQYDLEGRIVGAEALLRWHNPGRGWVPPDDFIPLAEETGLILPIGRKVLRAACEQIRAMEAQGMEPCPISVNVSPNQFRQAGFVDEIRETCARLQVPARLLELELTEGVLLDDVVDAAGKMEALRSLGVRIAIDDFGTGYSSLAYLKRLPVDRIKIDRSFICDIESDADSAAIVRTIVSMAQHLAVQPVAEGVETEAQLRFLKETGCAFFQGYLFSKPLPREAFVRLLSEVEGTRGFRAG